VLDLWPEQGSTGGRFTTVGSWRGAYGPIEWDGRTYGLRVHEFRKFVELPGMSGLQFELALDIDAAETRDLDLLRAHGWALADPGRVACDPVVYQRYVAGSKAEFVVAKNLYVDTRSGWFSDRSACYLASGKPVVAQDTGLDGLYPLGEGLVTFRTVDEAAAAVREIAGDYRRHARAARELAEAYFDSDLVLANLVDAVEAA
jgi:glycosyltransferase involved in cell wall biosynthesis